jgi:hypothetical protein
VTDLISSSGLQERVLHQTPIEGQAPRDEASVKLQGTRPCALETIPFPRAGSVKASGL